jgi:hypothetical protein
MSKLHKSLKRKHLVPKEEQPELLCSNKMSKGGSSLGFKSNSPLVTEEMLIDYLAKLLVEMFLASRGFKEYDEECGDLLSGID